MVVYIAIGIISYEQPTIIGVEDALNGAVDRCVETPRSTYSEIEYDQHWIEEWTLGAQTANVTYEVNTATRTARRIG